MLHDKIKFKLKKKEPRKTNCTSKVVSLNTLLSVTEKGVELTAHLVQEQEECLVKSGRCLW